MASYDYKVAKTILTDKEKDRLACLYLNRRDDGTVDWEKATADFDCASVASMRISTNNILKKIENAGGKIGASAGPATPSKATPSKTTPAKKRKGTQAEGDDADDEEAVPSSTKKGRKGKGKAAKEEQAADEDAATGDVVKDEPTSECNETD